MDRNYIFGYIMWSNFVVNGVFPFLLLIFLNIFIFKSIKSIQVSRRQTIIFCNDICRQMRGTLIVVHCIWKHKGQRN